MPLWSTGRSIRQPLNTSLTCLQFAHPALMLFMNHKISFNARLWRTWVLNLTWGAWSESFFSSLLCNLKMFLNAYHVCAIGFVILYSLIITILNILENLKSKKQKKWKGENDNRCQLVKWTICTDIKEITSIPSLILLIEFIFEFLALYKIVKFKFKF